MTFPSLNLLILVSCMGTAIATAEPVRELKFSAPLERPIAGAVRDLTPEKKIRLEAFAAKTVELLLVRDNFALRELADVESHANAIYDGLGFPADLEAGLKNDIRQNFRAPSAALLDAIVKSNPTHVAFVRLGEEHGLVYARFRQAHAGLVFEYFDLFPVESAEGTFLWVDMRTSASWERKITGMRRAHYAKAASRGDLGPKAAAGLNAADKLFLDFSEKILPAFKDPIQETRKEIVRYLDGHLAVVERNRRLSLMRIDAMSEASSSEAYSAAIDKFVETFPDDPTVPFLVFWSHYADGRLDEAFTAIDGVANAYGADPYLDNLRASVRGEQKRFPEAAEFARKGVASCPDAPSFHIMLMQFSSLLGDFAAVEREIKILANSFGLRSSAASLRGNPWLADYCESEEGMKFLRTLPE